MQKEPPMQPNDLHHRLSSIKTHWTALFQAHQQSGDVKTAAQQQLLLRYYGAVYRYLLGIVHDPMVAEELTQDFAVRFLRDDFHRADPGRGRFRDFLKTALRHLVQDHWRKQKKCASPLPSDSTGGLADPGGAEVDLDQPFLAKWREELLAKAWDALEQAQAKTGQPFFTALRSKTEQPQVRSAQLATSLSAHLGKPYTENAVRQLLHRARNLFADLLVEEVGRSLATSDPATLELELIELDLLPYCQAALARRNPPPGTPG
jgi:RNA polymerase sigma-70 factor (ECF subfamily)